MKVQGAAVWNSFSNMLAIFCTENEDMYTFKSINIDNTIIHVNYAIHDMTCAVKSSKRIQV